MLMEPLLIQLTMSNQSGILSLYCEYARQYLSIFFLHFAHI